MASIPSARAAIVTALNEANAALGNVVVVTPPPPTGTFQSVVKTTPVPAPTHLPNATPGQRVEWYLHGSGGANFVYGDSWRGIAAADGSMSITPNMPVDWHVMNGGGMPYAPDFLRVQMTDHAPSGNPSNPIMETIWRGYQHGPAPKVFSNYTERIMDALYAWCRTNFPQADWTKVVGVGNSSGGYGLLTYMLRRPDKFAAIFAAMPAWQPWDLYAIPDYELGADVYIHSNPLKMDDGTDYRARYDMIAYVSNPANALPWIGFAIGMADNVPFSQAQAAVAALRAANRGFAFAWGPGVHSDGPRYMGMIKPDAAYPSASASYVAEQFQLGVGYPIVSGSSQDQDPLVDTAGGVNLGFKWRNVVENAGSWSCELANVIGNTTVTVRPHSAVYTGSATPKTVTIPAGAWLPVTFP